METIEITRTEVGINDPFVTKIPKELSSGILFMLSKFLFSQPEEQSSDKADNYQWKQ